MGSAQLRTSRKRLIRLSNEALAGYGMVAPALVILAGLIGIPVIMAVYLSLTSTRVASPGAFIGLENFIKLVDDEIFWMAFWNSVWFTVIAVTAKAILGLGAAAILNAPIRGQRIIRSLVLLPWVIPTAFSTLA